MDDLDAHLAAEPPRESSLSLTGIGALWSPEATLDAMPPWQGGGEMISRVTFEKTTWNELPAKFEAGTPNIAGGAGFGAAIDYLAGLGVENVAAHEKSVLDYATSRMSEIDGLRIIGTAEHKAGVISFTLDDIHPHDLGTIIDHFGVALRTGHHCTMPLLQFFGVQATARASFGMYNTTEEVDTFIEALLGARDREGGRGGGLADATLAPHEDEAVPVGLQRLLPRRGVLAPEGETGEDLAIDFLTFTVPETGWLSMWTRGQDIGSSSDLQMNPTVYRDDEPIVVGTVEHSPGTLDPKVTFPVLAGDEVSVSISSQNLSASDQQIWEFLATILKEPPVYWNRVEDEDVDHVCRSPLAKMTMWPSTRSTSTRTPYSSDNDSVVRTVSVGPI